MEAWQIDPYRWEDEAEVLAVEPRGAAWVARTTPTILFPEGGGQPADQGTIGGARVIDVKRGRGGVEHLLDGPVPLGPARVTVDGARRFDHMQQHTGQHLLTATLIEGWDVGTTSFHLGPDHVAIELDAATLPDSTLVDAEERVNRLILEGRPVTAFEAEPEELAGLGVRSRGLPEGFAGRVRLVDIAGVDRNTCGGTHVRSTAELGLLKLLRVEGVGQRGCRLYFVYGGRVRRRLGAAVERELALNRLLSTGPDNHLAAVERLVEDRRALDRRLGQLEEQLADGLVARLAAAPEPVVERVPGAELRWLQVVAARFCERRPDALLVLLAPAEGEAGTFLLAGPPERVAALGPRVAAAVGGKGGGAKGRFQGKGACLDRALGVVVPGQLPPQRLSDPPEG